MFSTVMMMMMIMMMMMMLRRRRRKRRSDKRRDDDVLGGGGGGREKAPKSLHFPILFFVVLVHLLCRPLWREKTSHLVFRVYTFSFIYLPKP